MSGDTGLYSERFCESVNGIAPLRWGTGSAKISLLHGEEPQLPSPHRRPDGLLSLSLSLSLLTRASRALRARLTFFLARCYCFFGCNPTAKVVPLIWCSEQTVVGILGSIPPHNGFTVDFHILFFVCFICFWFCVSEIGTLFRM